MADRFILADMDTPEDYERVSRDWLGYDVPSPAECLALMVDVPGVPPSVER